MSLLWCQIVLTNYLTRTLIVYNSLLVITFDDAKRQINLRKHEIDFADCAAIFDAPLVTDEDDREAYGEQRLKSLG